MLLLLLPLLLAMALHLLVKGCTAADDHGTKARVSIQLLLADVLDR